MKPSKPAQKSAAPAKKAAKKISPGALNSAMAVFLKSAKKEEAVKLSDYAVAIAAKFKVDADKVKKLFGLAKQGEEMDVDALGDGVTAAQKVSYPKAFKQVQADYATHAKNRAQYDKDQEEAKANAKAEKEAEKKAVEQRKQNAIVVMDKSIETVAKGMAGAKSAVDTHMSKFIPSDKFATSKKTGMLIIRKDVTVSEDDFVKAFAGFANLNEMTEEIVEAAAEREAQMAVLAEKAFPETWQDYFSARHADLERIKKGMRVYKKLARIGQAPFGPMAAMRKAMEVTVEQGNDEKNLEATKKIVEDVVAFQTAKGRNATQAEITEIKNKVKNTYAGNDVYIKPKHVFVIQRDDGSIFVIRGEEDDKQLNTACLFAISIKEGMIVARDGEGDLVAKRINEPTKSQIKDIKEIVEAREAAAEGDAPDGDDDAEEADAAPVAPKKAAAKKAAKPAPKEEAEEEEEEEEAEAEAEDADAADADDADADAEEADADADADAEEEEEEEAEADADAEDEDEE